MSDLCAISHEPLNACAVTAACGHRFNPDPWEEYYNYEVNSGSGYVRIRCPICRATLGVVDKGAGMYVRVPPSMIKTEEASSILMDKFLSHPFDGKAYEMMTETLCLDGADEGGPPVSAYAAAVPELEVIDLTSDTESKTESATPIESKDNGSGASAASSSARGASSNRRGASSNRRRRTREQGQGVRNVRPRHSSDNDSSDIDLAAPTIAAPTLALPPNNVFVDSSSSEDEDVDSLTPFSLASALRQNNEYMRNLEYEPGHRYASQTINGKTVLGVAHESSDTFTISELEIYEDRIPLVYRSSDLYKTIDELPPNMRRKIATVKNVAMNHVIERTRAALMRNILMRNKKWFVVKMPSQNDPTIYVRLITQITQHNDSISWVKKTQHEPYHNGTLIDAPYHIGAVLPLVLQYTEDLMVNNPPIQPAPGQTRAEAMQQRVETIQNDAINRFVMGQENKAIMKRILKGTAGVDLIPIVGWYGFERHALSDAEWAEAAELNQREVTNITEKHSNYVRHKYPNLSQEERAPLIEAEVRKQLDIARARKVIRLKRRFKQGRTAPRPVTVVDLNGHPRNIWYFPRFNYKPSVQNGELIIRTFGDLFGYLYTTGARQLGQRSSAADKNTGGNSNTETAEVSTGAASAAPSTMRILKLRF